MKKGDFNISFNMIISIVIIAAVVGVAGYTMMYFIDLNRCSQLGLFLRDFQSSVDRAWNADSVENEPVSIMLPGSVEKVCLGNVQEARGREEYNELKLFEQRDANLFFYPRQACDIAHGKIEHLTLEGFRCITTDGAFSVTLNKGSFDALVRVS